MLPTFLIIGGMKCGSTTVYRDLMTNPAVFFPADKEPESLADDRVLTPGGRAAYEALFKNAREDQARGEASTGYTKLPDLTGAAGRARELLGPELKLIYIVRDPVARAISHHHHDRAHIESLAPRLADALDELPGLIEYGRYAAQARPWIDAFGRDALRVVLFEDYMKDRPSHAAELSRFIGVEPRPDLVDAGRAFNTSEAKPVTRGVWKTIATSPLYRGTVRKLLSPDLKLKIRSAILPKATHEKDTPDEPTVRRILDAVRDDHRELAALIGRPAPLWDETKLIAKHAAR